MHSSVCAFVHSSVCAFVHIVHSNRLVSGISLLNNLGVLPCCMTTFVPGLRHLQRRDRDVWWPASRSGIGSGTVPQPTGDLNLNFDVGLGFEFEFEFLFAFDFDFDFDLEFGFEIE